MNGAGTRHVVRGVILVLASLQWGCAHRYAVRGLVVAKVPGQNALVISHDEIPNFMGAMTMSFLVQRQESVEDFQPGDQVEFQLVVGRDSSYARRIRLSAGEPITSALTGRLPALPASPEQLAVGEPVVDCKLVDQDSRLVRLAEWRGKLVVMNFIYTRCPLAQVCPLQAANFSRLQKRFSQELGKKLMLLSVSLDPQYDTPEVLTRYAEAWHAKPEGWRFLTGSASQVAAVTRQFGIVYWPEEGSLTHTSGTAVLGADGRLKAFVEGPSYNAERLGDLIVHFLEDGS
ncbi:MAG: SCO family protein [Acidobacteriota bacterium]